MSNMSNVSTISNPPLMTEPTKLFIDIMIVAAVSGLSFVLEGFANDHGWIVIGEDARGVSAVLAGAFTAFGVVLARGGTLADLGFRRPERWAKLPFQVASILVVFVAMQTLVSLLISMFIDLPAPDLSRHAAVSGDLSAAIAMAIILPLTASIPEEVIYRGFLIGRLSDIFGKTTRGASMTVVVQAVIFGSVHFQWGIGGMIMTFCMGVVWGTAYLLCGRNLWVVILAHSAAHILFVTQLYLGESIII
jgi:membrane protease YdiL (CAAX protease family)